MLEITPLETIVIILFVQLPTMRGIYEVRCLSITAISAEAHIYMDLLFHSLYEQTISLKVRTLECALLKMQMPSPLQYTQGRLSLSTPNL